MARRIVDIAYIEATPASGQSKELTTVVSMTVNKTDPKTPVKTMNRNRRAIGYQRGVPDFQVDMEVVDEVGEREMDWDELMLSGELLLITYEESDGGDGRRANLIDCTVDEVSDPYTESGETRRSVKLMALDWIEEAP